MVTCNELTNFYDYILSPQSFTDFCPNGLQVEGNKEIKVIAFAVSATLDSITAAISQGADTLVVHHGLFWNYKGVKTITGDFGNRIIPLIKNSVNLLAYHLPLDANIFHGNAAIIGQLLKLTDTTQFGDYKGCYTGICGELSSSLTVEELQQKLRLILNHEVVVNAEPTKVIKTIGIITGGASNDWTLAKDSGLDAYITGEINHHSWQDSKEAGIAVFAGGHEATEIFGIKELMKITTAKYKVNCIFIESDNLV